MNPLVIIGSAPGVARDLAGIPGHEAYDHMAVGLSSLDKYGGNILYIANNHPENIPAIRRIMQERHEACGGNWQYKMIGPAAAPGVDIVEPYRPPTGSSAITGALAAIRMGYRKIILAGCPLTGNAPAGNPYEEFRFTAGMYLPETFMCLSFTGPYKHLKLGKGGAILTDDEQAYEWFKRARFSGRRECSYHHDTFDMTGWNFYMMPEIAARGLLLITQFYERDGTPRRNEDLEIEYPDLSTFPAYRPVINKFTN